MVLLKMANPPNLEIRRLVEEDLDTLFSFLADVYPDEPGKHSRENWRWQYSRNPLLTTKDYPTWIVRDNDEILAQAATMPFSLKVGDKLYPAYWLVDVIMREGYRAKGVGTKLFQAVLDEGSILISLDASEPALRIFEKLGCTFVGRVSHSVRMSNVRNVLTRKTRQRYISAAMAPIINQALKMTVNRHRPSSVAGLEVRQTKSFGEEFDALWQRLSNAFTIVTPRTSSFLNWRYVSIPHCSVSILEARREGQLAGYIVFERLPTRNRGYICDLFAAPDDEGAVELLFWTAICELEGQGVEAIETHVLHASFQCHLRRFGFVRRGAGVTFVVHPGNTGVNRSILTRIDNWLVTGIDSDLDPVLH